MGAGNRLRALVVDDDPDVRFVVRAILETEGYAVEAVADAAAADAAMARTPPDVAVIDLRLPAGREGLTLTRRLHDRAGTGVIVLSAEDAVEEKLSAFASGADDYVTKPFDARELVARVGAVSRRRARTDRILRAGDVAVDEDARVVTRAGHPISLTKLEFDLLVALVRRRGVVCSRSQLLGEVWGFDGLAGNVVEVHVSSLRRKLEAHGPRLVHTVRGVGYVVRA